MNLLTGASLLTLAKSIYYAIVYCILSKYFPVQVEGFQVRTALSLLSKLFVNFRHAWVQLSHTRKNWTNREARKKPAYQGRCHIS